MKMYLPEDMPTETRECEVHGKYTSTNYLGNIWSHCPECSRIENEERKKEKERKEKERQDALLAARIVMANIPPRFKDRTIDSFVPSNEQQQKALDICLSYANHFDEVMQVGRCLIMAGKPGTGKTHLSVGIGLHVSKHYRRDVLFSTVMRMIRRIKNTWTNRNGETEEDAIRAFSSVDLLILDEVGVQFGSETEEHFLFDIINERYENRRPTIIISNLDIEGIKSYLGERAFDRLREDGGKYIPFTWNSHRGK